MDVGDETAQQHEPIELGWDEHVTISAFRFDAERRPEEITVRSVAALLRCAIGDVEARLSALQGSLIESGVSVDEEIEPLEDRLAQAIAESPRPLQVFRFVGPDDDRFRYRIRPECFDEAARGGQMIVWRAEDLEGQALAVKIMTDFADSAGLEVALGRLRQAEEFSHPNLTTVRGVFPGASPARHPGVHLSGVDFDKLVLVEDWVEGRRLRQVLSGTDMSTRLDWVAQLAGAIGYLHNHRSDATPNGFVHRDLKPDNVFIDSGSGEVVVMDLASGRGAPVAQDSLTGFAGTRDWFAPEQRRSLAQIAADDDVAAPVPVDVYGVGALAHFILVGEPPAADHATTATSLAPPLKRLGVRRADGVAEHIATLLRDDPRRRPTDLTKWAAELQGFEQRSLRLLPRRRVARAAAAAIVVAGLGGGGWLAFGGDDPTPTEVADEVLATENVESDGGSSGDDGDPLVGESATATPSPVPSAGSQAAAVSAGAAASTTPTPTEPPAPTPRPGTTPAPASRSGTAQAAPSPSPAQTVEPTPVTPAPTATPLPTPTPAPTAIPSATPTAAPTEPPISPRSIDDPGICNDIRAGMLPDGYTLVVVADGGVPDHNGVNEAIVGRPTEERDIVNVGDVDVFCGDGGSDVINAVAGTPVIHGEAGNDEMRLLDGAGGAFYGGEGTDIASYMQLSSGVQTVFAADASGVTGTTTTAAGPPQRLRGVDFWSGTELDDVLNAAALPHRIVAIGLGGNDVITGTAFADVIKAGPGSNTVTGGGSKDHIYPGGDDMLDGGENWADDILDFREVLDGHVTISFVGGSGKAMLPSGSVVTFTNFRHIIGTSFDDVIDGSAGPAVGLFFQGADGDDSITGTAGRDRITGDAGTDICVTGPEDDPPETCES